MSSEELGSSLSDLHVGDSNSNGEKSAVESQEVNGDVEITCFTEDTHNAKLHFQIIRLAKQIYVWIGCSTAKLGHLYAASTTRPNNTVSVTPILGGASDNTGLGIARRLVLKTGLNVIVACNIPKDSPMIEAMAERMLAGKLRSLGYVKQKMEAAPITTENWSKFGN